MDFPQDFLAFIESKKNEDFIKSRAFIVSHQDYFPYSDDLTKMNELINQKEFEKVVVHRNINTLLSPRAHLMTSYAFKMLGDLKGAESENYFGRAILECIATTGNGNRSNPYVVLRVEDENDMLEFFLNEIKENQSLLTEKGELAIDVISTQSGKNIHFDITDAYKTIKKLSVPNTSLLKTKKWWEFWKKL
jgi:hypothetical protein